MEKEIYITETPFNTHDLNEPNLARDKSNPLLGTSKSNFQQRPHNFVNHLPPQNYYEDKKLKPGISFFKNILDIEERRANGEYSGPHLRVNIPETVILNDNSNSLISSYQGEVKVDSYITNQVFLAALNLEKLEEKVFPIVLHSSISGIGFNNSILMSNQILANKIIPRSEGFICRKFVRPYADTPNILRLYYTPESQKSMKKNYAYKMVSKASMDENMFKKKHRLTHHYLVNPEREGSYSLTLVKGKSLVPFEEAGRSLTDYLEKAYPVKITELILDFTADQDKATWLLDVKGIKSKELTKLWDIAGTEEIQLLTEKNNNSQLCRLCRMGFSKQELQKLVTNKLIWQLTVHLQSRGIYFPHVPHLKKEGLSPVCSVCYELIVAEHQLIDVEREFSALLNISSSDVQRVQEHHVNGDNRRKIWDQTDIAMSGLEMPKLKAWRLFFYIERIKYMDNLLATKPKKISLEMKFNQFKENFTKVIYNPSQTPQNNFSRFSFGSRAQSAKLNKRAMTSQNFRPITAFSRKKQSKCDFSQTTMASKISGSMTHTRQNLAMEIVKVMVLYTKKHQIGNMFEQTELNFTLALDDEKFEGRSFTLQQLKNKDLCQRHSSEVFLFNEKMEYCNLELTVGLICDGQADLDELSLEESDGIYYHTRPMSICSPLPDEWMEVFTKGEEVPGKSQELSYEDIHKEVPKMSKSKLKLKPLLPTPN